MTGIPRRSRIDLFSPAEKAIYDAMQVVESAGCHPLLTDAVVLLSDARNKVADFVDGVDRVPPVQHQKMTDAELNDLGSLLHSIIGYLRRNEPVIAYEEVLKASKMVDKYRYGEVKK